MTERPEPARLAPSTLALGVLLLVGAVGAIWVAISLINVLVTVFLAIILAESIRPAVERLGRLNLPRALAVLVIYLLIVGVVAGSLALVLPPLIDQIRALARQAPSYASQVRELLPVLHDMLQDLGLLDPLQAAISRIDTAPFIRGIAALPVQVLSVVISVLSSFVLAAFWLGVTDALDRDIVARLPAQRQALVRTVAHDLSKTWGGWLRGQLVLMLFVGLLSFSGLVALRVPFPVALAVWAGVTEILPILGPWLGGIPAVILATLESPLLGGLVFLLYIGVQQIENNLLVPKVMQRAVGLHPFAVLVALLAGGSLLGLTGIVIAIPLAAGIRVLVARLWLPPLVEDPAPQGRPSAETPPRR